MGFWIGSQDGLLSELRALREEVALLTGERDGLKQQRRLQQEVTDLKGQIETLRLEKGRIKEEQDRREREVRHEVGLLRKQVETEQELATQEAVLKVREENLAADKSRFEEQMEFTRKRFEKEVGYLRDLMGQILERLPTVTVDKQVGGSRRKDI